MLEPYAVKVASTVLKGLGVGNDLRLLDLSLLFYNEGDPGKGGFSNELIMKIYYIFNNT